MAHQTFNVHEPYQDPACVVFASPHSGSLYPSAFLEASVLDEHEIRSSEDAYVDTLFDCAPTFGAAFLCSRVPRAFVDLNRARDELDPALIAGVRRQGHNPRVASGLGVIPRVVANGRAIYRGKLSREEAESRLALYWQPYHDKLHDLLEQARQRHGQAVLIDCHSMPHEAMDSSVRPGMRRPDVVLGDRFGAAASGDVVDRVESAFVAAGFVVSRNAPFAGAYIAQAYGAPVRGHHVVQVEIDRELYMDESKLDPNAQLDAIRNLVTEAVRRIGEWSVTEQRVAAE